MSRLVDRGAIFAGWVGLGMALIIAIAFELIVAVQSVVFLIAPLAGATIAAYANVRAERVRPFSRVVSNALYAALVTGIGLGLLYGSIRLLFVYADSGFRVPGQGGQLTCRTGPACTYERYLAAGRGGELSSAGVTDSQTFERFVVREHLNGGLALVVLTLAGGAAAGAFQGIRGRSASGPAYAGS